MEYPRLNMLIGQLVFLPDRGKLPIVGASINWIPGGLGHFSIQNIADADSSHAASVIGADILDAQLGGQYLGPQKTARGWAFFQYPPNSVNVPYGNLLVKISDQIGNRFSYEIDGKKSEGNSNGDVLRRTTTLGQIVDLSRCPLERAVK